LHQQDYALDHVILKALNRMRMDSGVTFDADTVRAAIVKEREECDRLNAASDLLRDREDAGIFGLFSRALNERLQERRERIFRLLALLYSPQDIYTAYYSYQVRQTQRAAAIEFLDNILDAEVRDLVLPVLEEASDTREHRGKQTVQFISLDAALSAFSDGNDPWLNAIASTIRSRVGGTRYGESRSRIIGNR
jgi:hypothetical protein